MEMPKKVLNEASWLISRFGNRLRYLTTEGNNAIYFFSFPSDYELGFPVVYLYNGKDIEIKEGLEALRLINKYHSS